MSDTAPFEHVAADDGTNASISVDAGARASAPLSPYLTGKFCEHLGSNIYNGMEAQILRNPTFGSWRFSAGDRHPDGGVQGQHEREKIEGAVRHAGSKLGMDDVKPLVDAYFDGCAFSWFASGDAGMARFSPDAGPRGARAQRIEVLAASSDAPAGIRQVTFLPLHRARTYEYRIVARAQAPVALQLRVALAEDRASHAVEAPVSLSAEWSTSTGTVELPADAPPDATYDVSLVATEPCNVVVDRVLLYPADHVNHADPDVVRLLRESKLPLLRWPGGNFVSGYHWRDGVGPVDERPTRHNPAWGGLEYNLFGTDEFIAFCKEVGCEPLICVNAGNGTPQEAAAWVEYCNGSTETPMGRLRADNGHPEPYGITLWEVGNEIYGKWQVGWTTPGGNADRYARFRAAMLAADPSIELLGCGHGRDAEGEWNKTLIERSGETLTCITDHILNGCQLKADADMGDVFGAYMGQATQVEAQYRALEKKMKDAGSASPHVAITELQLFCHWHPDVSVADRGGANVSPRQDQVAEAIYYATIALASSRLGEFVRMITHSATVNHGGGLRKVRERAYPNPVHHAHAMLAPLSGGTPLGLTLTCATYATKEQYGGITPLSGVSALDAAAVSSPDGDTLTVFVVNRAPGSDAVALALDVAGFAAAGEAEVTTLAGESWSDANTVDEPERVKPRTSTAAVADGKVSLTLRPWSLTRITLQKR